MVRVGLIGAGNIGNEATKQIREKGYEVGPVLTTSGVYDASNVRAWERQLKHYLRAHPEYKIAESGDYIAPFKEVDAVFLAIPTRDNGEEASRYLDELFGIGKPVVTCEKGALSLNYEHFLEPIEKGTLGYRATVGGGTSMLPYMREIVRSGFNGRVLAVINATVNFMFHSIADGDSVGETNYHAGRLDIIEPGEESPLSVFNAEVCGDIPRKCTIMFNDFLRSVGEKGFITISSIRPLVKEVTKETFRELTRKAAERRYIVSITRPDEDSEEILEKFSLVSSGWKLEGGFREIGNDPLYRRLVPRAYNNAILIAEGTNEVKGVNRLTGPGAMPAPTTAAMMRDLDDMRKAGIVG